MFLVLPCQVGQINPELLQIFEEIQKLMLKRSGRHEIETKQGDQMKIVKYAQKIRENARH